MHILNMMFAKGGGGIEQAFIDYCEALQMRGHRISVITAPDAVMNASLPPLGITPVCISNFGEWDMLAACRLRRQIDVLKPDIVIAHGNRAFSLGRKAVKHTVPLVGMAQNYFTRRLNKADASFATTFDLINHLVEQGIARVDIHHIPNMVRCTEPYRVPIRNNPPVIGTLGRFVAKKGFDVYIAALSILKSRGYVFKAILGGGGEEEDNLKSLAQKAGLSDTLSFPGWIKDKKAFYSGLDIFCLPSLHEPFGIVLLEAFIYSAPVVSTDTEGPHDIITDGENALIVKKDNAQDMADKLAQLLDDPRKAASLAENAHMRVKANYSLEIGGERIERALNDILTRWKSKESAA